MRGLGYLYRPRWTAKDGMLHESAIWWWNPPGKSPRVSTGCRDRKDAEAWRIQRIAEMGRGSYVGLKAQALRYEDLEKLITDRFKADGLKMGNLTGRLKQIRKAWAGWKARDITTDQVTAYVARRREAGAAVATINLELAFILRMFRLAVKARKFPGDDVPEIRRLRGAHVRQDFLSDSDLERLLSVLKPHFLAPLELLHLLGWRGEEVLGLERHRVDWPEEELRLDTSKSGEPRRLPFSSYPELKALLTRQKAVCEALASQGIITPWVFPNKRGGRISLRSLERAWALARKKAGIVAVEGPFIHGLRRKASKDMVDAGIAETDAARITGHETLTTFRRYAIRDRAAKERALQRLGEHRRTKPSQGGSVVEIEKKRGG